jgi:hypothetical protein
MKELTHLYGQLNAKERFGVAVQALARGDMNELDRLIDTCPQKTYRMGDLAFFTRLRELLTIALMARVEILSTSYKALGMLSVLLALESGEEGEEGEEAKGAAVAEESYLRLSAMTKGKRAAWTDFCNGLGLDGDEVMRAFHFQKDDELLTELWDGLSADVEADDEARQNLLANLQDAWATVEAKMN